MRRKKSTLFPLELSILVACLDLITRGADEVHGFLMAKQLRDQKSARMLTAHGTLYKALARMEKAGLLASRWEDPVAAADESRPRRRLYHITAEGRAAYEAATAPQPQSSSVSERATT
jgi:DNA-binding PadR family transcriptional regulator